MPRRGTKSAKRNNGANLGFEEKLWARVATGFKEAL
jgi:hypothetical protein